MGVVSKISSYRDLLVWQQAMDLAVAVYELSLDWPRDELYGLTSQARRASVSIAANIAEGYGRESRGAYVNFLCMSQGSIKELETHLLIAQRVGIVSDQALSDVLERCESVGKLLRLLVRKLESEN
jgi:four helix bundle protein